MPTAEELADISIQMAGVVRRFGQEPRVALLAFSTFGFPRGERSEQFPEDQHRKREIARVGEIARAQRPDKDTQSHGGLQQACRDDEAPLGAAQHRLIGMTRRPSENILLRWIDHERQRQ